MHLDLRKLLGDAREQIPVLEGRDVDRLHLVLEAWVDVLEQLVKLGELLLDLWRGYGEDFVVQNLILLGLQLLDLLPNPLFLELRAFLL